LATEVVSVQKERIVEPVRSTDEVRPPTEGEEPVVETVGAPTLGVTEAAEAIAVSQVETKREVDSSYGNQVDTVPVSHPSSPASTAATAVTAGGECRQRRRFVRHADANEIMLMLEKTMEKVCEWSERIEVQTSATVERDMQVWKKRVVNCEHALKRKVASLTEAKKEQVALRRMLDGKDAELAKVRAELEAERRVRTAAEKLRGQLTEAQADVKSFKW
jgi:hypothetical protein